MSALVASPAAADEGTEVVLENAADAAVEALEADKAAEEEKGKKAAEEAAAAEAAAASQAAAEAAAASQAAEEATAALQAAEEENAKKAEEESDGPIVALLEPPDPEEVIHQIDICHSTGSHNNPYVINHPAADGDVSGHADHTGPIWFPGIEVEWGDIIPPFTFEGPGQEILTFEGLNWDAEGQAIFENDCKIPDRPDLVLTVTAHACPVVDGTGTVNFAVTGLLENVDYRVTILNAQGTFVNAVEFDGDDGTFEGSFNLPPGNYTIVLEEVNGDVFELTRQQFTIGACPTPPPPPPPPAPPAPVKALAATGTGTAEPFMAGGMIMLLLGGAALLAANRRRWGTSRSE